MPHQYPAEFRQRVLALVDAGARVADVAADLEVSANAIYNWRNQHLIDTGQRPGISTTELAELRTARREIERLRAENQILRRANDLMREPTPPKEGPSQRRLADAVQRGPTEGRAGDARPLHHKAHRRHVRTLDA